MDFFLTDPTRIPLPPEEIRIIDLSSKPLPDVDQIKVIIEISPFQQRPNLEIEVRNLDEEIIASISIIETITPEIDINMHMRGNPKNVTYLLSAVLYYAEIEESLDPAKPPSYPEQQVIHTREISFTYN